MELGDIQNILLTILTSSITGGFILVFVEIGNRKNRENDRYEQIMRPFMHKLSAYFRFVNWCSSHILYPKDMGNSETEFKRLVGVMSDYGGKIIMVGGDYGIEDFPAKKLSQICNDINSIWYYYDKMRPCMISWDGCCFGDYYIDKELKAIFPEYLSSHKDVGLLSQVSGHFYTEIYQPIEDETYRHEAYNLHFKRQTVFVSFAVAFVLMILGLMLFMALPVWSMRLAGSIAVLLLVLSLMLLGVDVKRQIRWVNLIKDKLTTIREVKNMKKKNWEALGMLLILFAFGWQCGSEHSMEANYEGYIYELHHQLETIWQATYDEAVHSDYYKGTSLVVTDVDVLNRSMKDWSQIKESHANRESQYSFFFTLRIVLYSIGSILVIASKWPQKLDNKE